VGKGRGYRPADENKDSAAPIGEMAIDSIFTPIRNVKYTVEDFRVEQRTDYEQLVMEITTDGTVDPEAALKEAAHILIKHFMLFSDETIKLKTEEPIRKQEVDENFLHMRKLLKTPLTDLDLSVRAFNCLKAAEVKTLGDLVSYNIADLLKFRNFGKKSLSELEDLVADKGLTFGMDVAKYRLDED
jgi:DNA-directed RNA polymerase subunit alpha